MRFIVQKPLREMLQKEIIDRYLEVRSNQNV